ncbi:MAG: SsrA-binding protein [Flammeovirgaceae bacterium]|nr:SsrA-binding protein [Flammeovirgaceae bacterium]|tara:strand:+ start:7161 stop:7616 length:456 start_codon:yes stop_codon:yes gene_type:complete
MNFKNFLIKNKKANFNYDISDKYTAGMVLKGTEIKSLKESKVNFSNSYCLIIDDQVYLKGMNISEYLYGNINNHDPDRDRKLLLNKNEIKQIKKKVTEKKLSIVPIKLFINNRGYVKLEIGLGKGKKSFDKREDIKKRDIDRNLRESLKNI